MNKYLLLAIVALLVSCGSPRLLVDPASVTDPQKAAKDEKECTAIAANVDKTGEAVAKTASGALVGGGVAAGAAALAFGAVFPPALPFIIGSGVAGGGLWGSSATKEEKEIKERILRECMLDRGYRVYSAQ
jgi:hypothetical protein